MSSITFETSPTSSSESTSITDCPLLALASSLASTEVASIPKNKSQIKSNLLNLKCLINIVKGIPPLTKTPKARSLLTWFFSAPRQSFAYDKKNHENPKEN